MTDLLTGMRAFAHVVDSGTFAGAARVLGVSRPALTNYIAQLERQLGTQLLVRSTRRVSTTPAGRAFYPRAVAVLEQADEAVRSVTEEATALRGTLRVNAPMSFGHLHLADAVAAFLADHPDVQLELVLNDRFVDLIAEGFDVSVRIAEPEFATSLVVEPLTTTARLLCASPGYLAGTPPLEHPGDLKQHRCLYYGYQASGHVWQLQGPDFPGTVGSRLHTVPVRCSLWSNNGEVLRKVALSGEGVALLPTFIVGGDLAEGSLVRVLPDYTLSALTVHALYPRHKNVSARVRAIVAHLKAWFAGHSTWAMVD
ncbi:MAG: LysR family transcriptional regulator [Pseudomonadales bacterium]